MVNDCRNGHHIIWESTYDFKYTKWKCKKCGKIFYHSLNLLKNAPEAIL